MKNLLLAIMLALAPMSALVTTTGCKTSQQVIAYKSLASTQVAVDSARTAFLAQYRKGLVTPENAALALQASEKFNAAFNAAVIVTRTTQAPTPANVAEAANAFLSIVATFTH
jgi:methionine-rich copper-binding protein CopC